MAHYQAFKGYFRLLCTALAVSLSLQPAFALTTINTGGTVTWNDPAALNDSLLITNNTILRILNSNGVDGGNLTINLNANGFYLQIDAGSTLNLSAQVNGGMGGNLTVNDLSTNTVVLINGSILSNGLTTGRGGTISLSADALTVGANAVINALGGASGNGGVINLTRNDTGTLSIGNAANIRTSGNTTLTQNLITITGDHVTNDGQIVASGQGNEEGGQITLTARNGRLRINKNGDVLAQGAGTGTGGTVIFASHIAATNWSLDNCGNATCSAGGDTELLLVHDNATVNVTSASGTDGDIHFRRAGSGTIDFSIDTVNNTSFRETTNVYFGNDGGLTTSLTLDDWTDSAEFNGSDPHVWLYASGNIDATDGDNDFSQLSAFSTGGFVDIYDNADDLTIRNFQSGAGVSDITVNGDDLILENATSAFEVRMHVEDAVTATNNINLSGAVYIEDDAAGQQAGIIALTNNGALNLTRLYGSSATITTVGATADMSIADTNITNGATLTSGRDISAGGTNNNWGTTTAASGRNVTLRDNSGTFVLDGVTTTGTLTLDTNGAGNSMTLANIDATGTTNINTVTGGGDITGNTGLIFRGAANIDTNDNAAGDITITADFQGNTTFYGDRVQATDTAGNFTVTGISTGSTGATNTLSATAVGGDLSVSGMLIDTSGAANAGRLDISAHDQVSVDGTGWNTTDDILNVNSTNGGNIALSNIALLTTAPLTGTTAAAAGASRGLYVGTNGGSYTLTNVSVNNNTSIQAADTITGTGNTFTGTTNFDANLGTAYDISLTASDFQNATNVFDGEDVTVADTNALAISGVTASQTGTFTATGGANDLTISNAAVTGNTSMTSGRNITATASNNFGTITGTANGSVAITETSDVTVNTITNAGNGTVGLTSTNGSIMGKNTAVTDLTTGTGVVTLTAGDAAGDASSVVNMKVSTGGNVNAYARGQDGSNMSVNLRGTIAGNLVAQNNAGGGATIGNILLGSAVDNLGVTGTTAFNTTDDMISYGNVVGAVSGTAARIGVTDTAGDFTSGGLTASSGTGWNGASDESLIVVSNVGDILGTGYTASGAGNIRLQAGIAGAACTACNVNVANVSAAQNLSIYTQGDTTGAGNGNSITVNGTSNVAGSIIASGFNSAYNLVGTAGSINMALSSGNLTTGLAWAGNDDITLTASNGSILQNSAAYPFAFNGKTIHTGSGGDVYLNALGGAGSYIDTGVNALGAGSNLTARAQGQNGSNMSIRLYGRVDGNLNAENQVGGNTTGDVFLGTSVGNINLLNDVYTVMDVVGNTNVKSARDVSLYGYYGNDINVDGRSLVVVADKVSSITKAINFGTVNLSGTSGTVLDVTVSRGSILGGNITANAGTGNVILRAGTSLPQDKMTYVNLTNVNTGGNLTVWAAGSDSGDSSGNSITITGTTGGTTSTFGAGGVGAPIGNVSTP